MPILFSLQPYKFLLRYSSISKTEAVGSSEMYPSSTHYSATSKTTITLNYGALHGRTNFTLHTTTYFHTVTVMLRKYYVDPKSECINCEDNYESRLGGN
jgi:hypothetical protein